MMSDQGFISPNNIQAHCVTVALRGHLYTVIPTYLALSFVNWP